jgi:hypothetical protein
VFDGECGEWNGAECVVPCNDACDYGDCTDCAGLCYAIGEWNYADGPVWPNYSPGWVGNSMCDDGTWSPFNFACDKFNCDEGDCLSECGECCCGATTTHQGYVCDAYGAPSADECFVVPYPDWDESYIGLQCDCTTGVWDCNGQCLEPDDPLAYLLDCHGVCKAPYYVLYAAEDGMCDDSWACEEYDCDSGDCGEWNAEIGRCIIPCLETDCDGTCYKTEDQSYESWIGNGACDDGSWTPFNFACDEFNCDEGDCLDDCGNCCCNGYLCDDQETLCCYTL